MGKSAFSATTPILRSSNDRARVPCTRRRFLKTLAAATVPAALSPGTARGAEAIDAAPPMPLKIGIRAASMRIVGNLDVIRVAAGIPGIRGVELQVTAGRPNLRDWDTVRQYKREAARWGLHIPSLAGVWDAGVKIHSPGAADNLVASIRAAELLGASVILVAFFKQDAPDMTKEASYGPLVTMLQKAASRAADAGVIMGLENSLSPADNKQLVDLVNHPAVAVYYDLHNMAFYGHGEQAIPGVRLLGRERICMVHVKNEKKLVEEPGRIDWVEAFRAFNEIKYDGWYVYETAHDSLEDCLKDTARNNAFLARHVGPRP